MVLPSHSNISSSDFSMKMVNTQAPLTTFSTQHEACLAALASCFELGQKFKGVNDRTDKP